MIILVANEAVSQFHSHVQSLKVTNSGGLLDNQYLTDRMEDCSLHWTKCSCVSTKTHVLKLLSWLAVGI